MNQHKWQIGPVKLANGEEALIDAINEGQEDYRYTGRIRGNSGRWVAWGWDASGRYMYAETDHPCNLAPPPKKTVRVQRWMAVYPSGSTETFLCKAEAIMEVNKFGFALIEIDREVEEGDGLS
jgi:hypothetical protein